MALIDLSPIPGTPTPEPEEEPLTNLPQFSAPREVTTLNENGEWQIDDSFGDFRLGIATIGGVRYYLIIWHYFGGVVARKVYDGDPYEGWPSNAVASPVQALPRSGLSAGNWDTWDWIQNPNTGLITATGCSKPGVLPTGGGETGFVHCIQRATAMDPTSDPADWTRDDQEVILEPHASAPWEGPTIEGSNYSGGVLEQSMVVLPDTQEVAIFYDGDVVEPGNPTFTGATRYRRMGRAVAPLSTFDTLPAFSRTPAAGASSWVWSQIENGMLPGQVYGEDDEAVWGTALVPRQAHVSRNPVSGYLHKVEIGARPNVLIGPQNNSTAIGLAWSADDGLTWTTDVNSPIINKDDIQEALGVPITDAFFVNSPNLFWDVEGRAVGDRRIYLAFAGAPAGVYQEGTRLLLCEACF